jgi:hypothetical protein
MLCNCKTQEPKFFGTNRSCFCAHSLFAHSLFGSPFAGRLVMTFSFRGLNCSALYPRRLTPMVELWDERTHHPNFFVLLRGNEGYYCDKRLFYTHRFWTRRLYKWRYLDRSRSYVAYLASSTRTLLPDHYWSESVTVLLFHICEIREQGRFSFASCLCNDKYRVGAKQNTLLSSTNLRWIYCKRPRIL